MLRKLIIWLLLAPMPLNGLWMVCNDAPSDATAAATGSPELSDQAAECIRICAMKHQASEGAICFLLPGNAKSSITIIGFGAAILPPEIGLLQALAIPEQFVTELPLVYSNPSLSNPTPPPRV